MPPRDPTGDLCERDFGTIENATHFTRRGAGPIIVDLTVRANTHPNTNYPRARIVIGQITDGDREFPADFGGMMLSIDQAGDLVKMLRAAIAECTKNCPSLAVQLVIGGDS